MGRVIFAYRTHPFHGQTLPQELVAGWLGLTQAQLSRIENGRAPDGLDKLIRFSRILEIPAGLLWFRRPDEQFHWNAAATGHESQRSSEDDDGTTSWLEAQKPGSDGRDMNPVDRRELMGFLVGSAAVASMPAFTAGRPVDPALIDHFERQLSGHYQADLLLGPRALVGTVAAQCALLVQLTDDASGPLRQRLARVGASFATFTAWLWLDAGDIAAALRWHDVAQELARRSGDREVVACALVDRAMAFTDLGEGRLVVDLCQSALLDTPRLSPEIRVFALQQQAHGASLLGDDRQVDRCLDQAARLLPRVDAELWGTACQRTPSYVEVQRATCYGRLGKARQASRLWDEIMHVVPSDARRDIGVWSARRAVAAVALGELDRAANLADRAAEIALVTGSARASRELAQVAKAIKPWRDAPIVRELADSIAIVTGKEDRRHHG
jgi:transcriptional regulator with XRE-family HTH domain/tetratricopeptide (TPR) repeat protein